MRMNAVDITPADLPDDWVGWMVQITKRSLDGSFEVTRGPVQGLGPLPAARAVVRCDWLERRGEFDPGTGKHSWGRLGIAVYDTPLNTFTLTRDPEGVVELWSEFLDETFLFFPPAVSDRTE